MACLIHFAAEQLAIEHRQIETAGERSRRLLPADIGPTYRSAPDPGRVLVLLGKLSSMRDAHRYASPRYATRVEVSAGQQEVWAFLTDFANDPLWTPFTTHPHDPPSVGLELVRTSSRSSQPQSWVVAVCREPHELCLTRRSPAKAHMTDCFRLVALDVGTRVERTVETNTRRFGWILRLLPQRAIDELLGEGLEDFAKALAERRGNRPAGRR